MVEVPAPSGSSWDSVCTNILEMYKYIACIYLYFYYQIFVDIQPYVYVQVIEKKKLTLLNINGGGLRRKG